jgi:DNA-binding beta-propeller fold protein YncE
MSPRGELDSGRSQVMRVGGRLRSRPTSCLLMLLALAVAVSCGLPRATEAAGAPVSTATAHSRHSLPIAPYSANPPANKPYRTCPPPTKTRYTCSAVAVPAGAQDRVRPSLEGSGELGGFSPADLASAYKLPSKGGSGLTIAIVAAYDYPTAEADLAVYRSRYGLSACTTANGCFKKVNQKGETKNYPEPEWGWSTEMALDLDMASAICPECKIILVEGNEPYDAELWAAVDTAAALGATVISNSWGRDESASELEGDKHFNHPGVPITAATGDWGYGTLYPAASPYVIAVGGTSLRKDAGSTRGWTEEVWSGAGSGCSPYEAKPKWQTDAKCGKRVIADVAAVSDPATGVSIYDSYEFEGWSVFGGTSAATPILAGVEALSSGATRAAGPEAFYKAPTWLADITVGQNALGYAGVACTPPTESEYLCTGELGYDGPTGNGVPILTVSGKPAVASRASEVKSYSATLQGTVNPEGSATTYQFEYGESAAYGERVPVQLGNAGSGTTKVAVSGAVANLNPERTYHYRLVATNAKGTTYGEDHTFYTASPTWAPTPTYSSTFGSKGTGDGQFNVPVGVAVESSNGVIVVLDNENSTVQEFTESGAFIRKFGSKGTGNGQFEAPNGVATDPKGNIWVADTSNNRIQQFTEAGAFIRAVGSEGSGNGKFLYPAGVATDAEGNVWVADAGNNRIQGFTESGAFIRSFSTGLAPTGIAVDADGNIWNTNALNLTNVVEQRSPTGALMRSFGTDGRTKGQFTQPRGLAIDANGNVWVTDGNHNFFYGSNYSRVQVFSKWGVFEGEFGTEGSGPGQMQQPTALALDPRGNVWIAGGFGNPRIDKWKVPSPWPPTYSTALGTKGSGNGQFNGPTGVAVEPGNGVVVALDSANNTVQEFTESGAFIRKFGSKGTGNGQFEAPNGVATDPKGNIWVADTSNNRIQQFTEAGAFIRAVGSEGSGNGKFLYPYAVTTDAEGNVWVADSGNNRIQKFSETGTYLSQFATGSEPVGIAIDAKGNVWNSNFGAGTIEAHTKTGTLVRSFGKFGEGKGELWSPRGVSVDSSGNVWVADQNNSRVQVFSETGAYLTTFGSKGAGSEQMQSPTAVALDPRGNAWVADNSNFRIDKWKVPSPWPPTYSSAFGTEGTGDGQFKGAVGVAVESKNGVVVALDFSNKRVQEFTASGEFIRKFGSAGSGNGQFNSPNGVATDPKGNIWVADTNNNRIQQFTESGAFIRAVGSEGTADGKFKLPSGVATDTEGNVWVADSGNNRLQEFTESGEFIRKFSTGSYPVGVAIDAKGNVWNSNFSAATIEAHTKTGTFIRSFGKLGEGKGEVKGPRGISVDSSGSIWVAEQTNNRVQVFSETGAYLTTFGSKGAGSEQMLNPAAVALDPRGNVWVADNSNARIDKWKR